MCEKLQQFFLNEKMMKIYKDFRLKNPE